MDTMNAAAEMVTKNPGDRIALRGVRVKGSIVGLCQRVVVEQVWVNLEAVAVEAVYTFPLPEGAAVCGFEVVTGDRVLTGVVEEREKAIDTYEGAVNEGDGGFLLEQERPDVFTVRVGNLKGGQAALVKITYVENLDVVDRGVRVAYPTVVGPRYVTESGGADREGMMVDGEALNPPRVMSVPYGLTLEVEMDFGRGVRSVGSPTHGVRVMTERTRQRLTLFGEMGVMDRDVVLVAEFAGEVGPAAVVGVGGDGGRYVSVTFVPEFGEDVVGGGAAEVVFLVDCSGSMQGESIERARRALELCLRSMAVGDRFNVVRFGSGFEEMAGEPLVYSEKTLARALEYVGKMEADLGGTELYGPLEKVLGARGERQVIVMTDGQVSNEREVIELARRYRGRGRIFSFGIGAAPSAYLVKGLARVTGGAAEFIAEGEEIAEKVLRTFARVGGPAVSGVGVDWGGADVEVAGELGALFEGDGVRVVGRVKGEVPARVTLRGVVGGGEKREWVARVGEVSDSSGVIAAAWGREMVGRLEERKEKGRLVEVAKAFNLLSSETAFVAVEHRSEAERNEGRPVLRRVPVMLARGWGGAAPGGGPMGGMGRSRGAAAPVMCDMSAMSAAPMAKPAPAAPVRAVMKKLFGGAAKEAAVAKAEPVDPLYRLLGMQGAEGWFALVEGAVSARVRERAREVVGAAMGRAAGWERVADVVAVLAELRKAYADRRDVWKRAAEKAGRWVASQVEGAEVERWVGEVVE